MTMNMPFELSLTTIAIVAGSLMVAVVGFATLVVRKVYCSVQPCAPKGRFLKEDFSKCQLYKYIPEMTGKIAWMDLKNNYPTPVHNIELPAQNGVRVPVYLKREDLSNDKYGGNKVRTLEFTMANAACQMGEDDWLHAFGGAGSNNCVIVSLIGKMLGIKVNVFWGAPEGPSYDNSLNALSCVSLAAKISPSAFEWIPVSMMQYFYRLFCSKNDKFLFLGGQNKLGALGHLSAVMEIAEDIERGLCPDPAYIVLPAGSGCTTSGILLGIAFARTVGVGFKRPLEEFKLQPVFVLPEQQYIEPLIRWFTVMTARNAAKLIKQHGGPDILDEFEKVAKCLEFQTSYAGVYGSHTPESLKAKQLFKNAMKDRPDIKSPWICSCFTGKSGAYLMDLMEKVVSEDLVEERPIFYWQTKSAVQPYGDESIKNFPETLPSCLKKYVNAGGVHTAEDVFGKDRQQMHPIGGVRLLNMNKSA